MSLVNNLLFDANIIEAIDSKTTLLLHVCQTWLDRDLDLGDVLFPDAPWEPWHSSSLRISFGKRKPNVAMRTGFISDQPKSLEEFKPGINSISAATWIANISKSNFDTALLDRLADINTSIHLDVYQHDPYLTPPTITMMKNSSSTRKPFTT